MAIIETFKTWRHYLEGYKHKVLVLTDHNNLQHCMDTKRLSSKQVQWAQELSRYHFRIDYQQGKANRATDALSQYLQRNSEEKETFRAKNTKILHQLQSLLARVSGLSVSRISIPEIKQQVLSSLHQIFICGTVVLPQLHQFWDSIWSKLADKSPYTTSIGGMRMRLPKLQDDDKEAKELRSKQVLLEGCKDIEQVLHYQVLLYVPKVIHSELINRYHNNLLADPFGIEKTQELIARKYYWPMLQQDAEAYVKGCDIYLAAKAVCYKLYENLQLLLVPTHWWKNLSIDFVIGLPISADWKDDSYDSILVIVNRLTKMIYYVLVKVTINIPGLAKVIINVIMRHHKVSELIVIDWGLFFTSKFWSSLCYFLGIKKKLSTAFHPQTNGHTEQQNSTMKAYIRAFVNWAQDDWARLLPMAEFAYNNAKNASTGYTPFELNCGYHPRVSFEENIDHRSKSRSADKLAGELRELMEICCQKLLHAQKLQKRAHDKRIKGHSYAPGKKIWLNSKYIKTKRNKKLESKFFGPFKVFHAVGKQVYKLELPMKWKIHDVFYVSLLE